MWYMDHFDQQMSFSFNPIIQLWIMQQLHPTLSKGLQLTSMQVRIQNKARGKLKLKAHWSFLIKNVNLHNKHRANIHVCTLLYSNVIQLVSVCRVTGLWSHERQYCDVTATFSSLILIYQKVFFSHIWTGLVYILSNIFRQNIFTAAVLINYALCIEHEHDIICRNRFQAKC